MSDSRRTFLVTGGRGQIGFELLRELAPLGRVVAPTRAEMDLADASAIRETIRRVAPDVIVNAGAYTAVDAAESDRAACFAVNETAPAVMASEAKRRGAALIHYSTDYVFDGAKPTPYEETDMPAPLNVYGASKLAGERAIAAEGGAWIVLRASWVFGTRGRNFLTTITDLAARRDELRVVDDQVGAPTWCRAIAAATAQILSSLASTNGIVDGVAAASGIYHLSAADATSWYGFARAILDRVPARQSARAVSLVPVTSAAFGAAARRPPRSVLSNDKIARRFGIALPSWTTQLERALEQPLGQAVER